eukprot:Skav221989  [mRNA]  locus=scaffold4375:625:1323:- [translate_table: standard]
MGGQFQKQFEHGVLSWEKMKAIAQENKSTFTYRCHNRDGSYEFVGDGLQQLQQEVQRLMELEKRDGGLNETVGRWNMTLRWVRQHDSRCPAPRHAKKTTVCAQIEQASQGAMQSNSQAFDSKRTCAIDPPDRRQNTMREGGRQHDCEMHDCESHPPPKRNKFVQEESQPERSSGIESKARAVSCDARSAASKSVSTLAGKYLSHFVDMFASTDQVILWLDCSGTLFIIPNRK